MSKLTATMLFKVEPELKADFQRVCKAKGTTTSKVLRQLMSEYVKLKSGQ